MALAERLLQMAKQFLMLTFGEIQVVIGKLGELLPELAFQLMPFTFKLELVHDHDQVRRGLGSMSEHLERTDHCLSQPFACHAIAPPFHVGPEAGVRLL